jgi:imidazole glycerol-phosphate synthase subunit HisF
MLRTRVIPVLLIRNKGLIKTSKFVKPVYVGDPINAVKIFNDKEVYELAVFDVNASRDNKPLDVGYIKEMAAEAFMPLCYGGGLKSVEDIVRVFRAGVEKASLNSAVLINPNLVQEAAQHFGSQSILVCIDVKKNLLGQYRVANTRNSEKITLTNFEPVEYAQRMEELGAGELIVQSVDRDGTGTGYDAMLVQKISSAVSIPVIACGGAGTVSHFAEAVQAGASAVAAGQMFVFQGKHRAVLISYPSQNQLSQVLGDIR